MDNYKRYAIEDIIDEAKRSNEIADFGQKVADILKDNQLIDEAVYEILSGQ